MPPTKLHDLKTSISRVCCDSGGLNFPGSESIEQPTFPEFCIGKSPASPATSLLGVHREVDASRRFTRSSSERLDSAAVFGFSSIHACGESQLSRHSRSGIHRKFEHCSRSSFTASVPNRTSPNHALQRTTPHVTACASHHLRPRTGRAVLRGR